MHCVIGSGPAGVACASALLDRGAQVRMIDGGVALDPARMARVSAMGSQSPADWSEQDLQFIKEGTESTAGGVPLKRLFGSDFPYREAEERLRLRFSGVGVKASLARGGFSNVWGAAVLPYTETDLVDWPFNSARLDRHYRAATAMIGLSAQSDDLAEKWPLYTDRAERLELSRQAGRLLSHMETHEEDLRTAGLSFGRSRLAVAGSGQGRPGCVYCGLCMYGCPYGLIYNAASTVEALKGRPGFSYEPGLVAEAIRETETGAAIFGRDRATDSPSVFNCDRVYLAAGTIPSTQILLRSMDAFDHPLRMMDSQYYLIPMMLTKGVRGVRDESLHTLSQLYVEMCDRTISPYTVHLQVYTYNDLIGQLVRRSLGPLAGVLEPVARAIEGRLIVLQGYLHSTHSATIRLELVRGGGDDDSSLHVTGEPKKETRIVLRRVQRKLMRNARLLGAVPLLPMVKVAEPGRGFHTGGTFPMRKAPGRYESDVLGRPAGWRRVHVVDATVLPSIAATTITFTVMANAHRIGWESMDL
jgi:choline dehydrogenase-like flavoprotein